MVKKKNIKKINSIISVFAGVTLAYFVWISWQKLNLLLGNSNLVWSIAGIIVILSVVFGYLGSNTILKKFS